MFYFLAIMCLLCICSLKSLFNISVFYLPYLLYSINCCDALIEIIKCLGLLSGGSVVKESISVQVMHVQSLGQEDCLEKETEANFIILAWRIHRQRSLAGYSPWGCKNQTRLGD